jgi:hypothetical protein
MFGRAALITIIGMPVIDMGITDEVWAPALT